MPRTARGLIDGGTYHVLARGNNGQTIFHDDADRQQYLRFLSKIAGLHQLQLYHFVLMPNHVHLLLKTSYGEALSRAMLSLNLTYSLFYRKRYGYRGYLWQGRFKSFPVDQDRQLLLWGSAIELHPVRTGLVLHPADYPWSSYAAYAYDSRDPLVTLSPMYASQADTDAERQVWYRKFVEEALLAAQDGRSPSPLRTLRPGQARQLEVNNS